MKTREEYIQQAAVEKGIDPGMALAVYQRGLALEIEARRQEDEAQRVAIKAGAQKTAGAVAGAASAVGRGFLGAVAGAAKGAVAAAKDKKGGKPGSQQ